jgi:DNA-binding PadR family transcriptional regulator
MKSISNLPDDSPPLSPSVFHILLALVDGEQHGYAIMQEIASSTGGALQIGPGSLYGTIKRMLAGGLIEEAAVRPDPQRDDERRRYYRLTPVGRNAAQVEARRLEKLVQSARHKKLIGLRGAN